MSVSIGCEALPDDKDVLPDLNWESSLVDMMGVELLNLYLSRCVWKMVGVSDGWKVLLARRKLKISKRSDEGT